MSSESADFEPRTDRGHGDPGGEPAPDDRLLAVFAAVVELHPDQRVPLLAEMCGDDRELMGVVQELLRHHDDPSPVLRALVAPPAPATLDLAVHTTLGPYDIAGVLGRGGMGIVYRALQRKPRREVALKLLSPVSVDVESVQRFEREIEVLGLLQHPGICRIYEAGTFDLGLGLGEVLYFTMELVEGLPLTQFVDRERLDVRARCALLVEVADAVHHAHQRGVIHRDLKPNNVLVVRGRDGNPQPKVLDFGIARTLGADFPAATTHTRTGSLLGTLEYMSPEQLNGEHHGVDARTDVYALGVILYELLAGRVPLQLQAVSLTTACRMVAEREPAPLGRIDRRLRGDLEVIVARALAKERDDRYDSAADFAADLRRHLRGEPIAARSQTGLYHLRRFARRHRALVGGVVATLLALTAGLVAVAFLARSNHRLATLEAGARQLAEATSGHLRRALYAAQMRLCSMAFMVPGGVARAREVLADWQPGGSAGAGDDLRGFEWYLLDSLCHQAALVAPCEATASDLSWLSASDCLFSAHWHCGVLTRAGTGEVLERFDAHVQPLALSVLADDRSILVQSVSPTRLSATDLRTRTPLADFAHPCEVLRCGLSPDGSLLAVSTIDGSVAMWATRSGQRVATLPGMHSTPVVFSRDGALFAASVALGRVRIWRTAAWEGPYRELVGPADYLLGLSFDADGRALATCGQAGWLRVFDVERGEQTTAIPHQDGLRRVAFAPHGSRVAVACQDYAAYVHDLASGSERQLCGHGGIVGALAWSPDGTHLATMGDDRTLRVWDLAEPPTVRVLTAARLDSPHEGQLLWADGGQDLCVRIGDGVQKVLPLAHGTIEPAPGAPRTFAVPVAGGEYVARLSAKSVLEVRAKAAPAGIAPDSFVLGPWQCLAASAATPAIAVGARGSVRVWRFCAAKEPVVIPITDVCRGLAWRADGKAIAVVDGSDVVRVFEATRGELVASRRFPDGALELDCAPSGDAIAVACVDQVIRIWSPARGLLSTLTGHASHVLAVAFDPGGTRLASGGQDRTVKIWDASDGSELLSLPHDAQVCAVAWSPDGHRLASLDMGGRVKVWDASAGHTRPAARR